MNAWEEEKEHLRQVIPVIVKQISEKSKIARDRKHDVMDIRRHFWDDIALNLDTPDDLLETAADLTQQTLSLTRDEQSYAKAVQSLRRLERQLPSPYFGRVDFAEGDSGIDEPFYIGMFSLMDEETGEPVIYDWRAPVSQLFYDFAQGPAEYEVPDGSIGGRITRKRQYVIRRGELENMFDTGIHIVDELLLRMLGKSADDKMKSIVTTIQREQNQIIRDDRYALLIVQGTAGSGKTSVALQRVAYLLYKYRNSLVADQILLFSPNRLFNDYVSTVLPELGERNMRQTTFQEYLEHRLEADIRPEDVYGQIEALLLQDEESERRIRLNGIRYKASADFVRVIRGYAEMLQTEGLRFKDFYAAKELVLSGERLQRMFYRKDTHLPVSRRLNKLREWLEGELADKQEELTQAYYRKLLKIPRYIGTEPELRVLAKRTMRKRFAPLLRMAARLTFIDPLDTYRALFADEALFARLAVAAESAPPADWAAICRQTEPRLAARDVPHEDAVPLLYFCELLEGFRVYHTIRHVIVDEAQDYSPFHYELLRRMFPRSKMTLLGDWNQAIFPHSVQSDYRAVQGLFEEDQSHAYRLFKSYRPTAEIVDFTRTLLPDGERVEAFSRHGERPLIRQVEAEEKLAEAIGRDIQALRQAGAQSIAVICQTAAESLQAFRELGGSEAAALVTKDTRTFVSGLLVIPAYLAKGLEFDAVIVRNASERVYRHDSERKLFYTACTRAMHHLRIFSVGQLTPFISEAGLAMCDTLGD